MLINTKRIYSEPVLTKVYSAIQTHLIESWGDFPREIIILKQWDNDSHFSPTLYDIRADLRRDLDAN